MLNKNTSGFFHMMAKPISYHCNLKCEYCFYLEKSETLIENKLNSMSKIMSDDVLLKYTRDYIESQESDEIDFSWQGGEPTLAGIEFYKKAIEYQKKYSNGKTITNSFQTNATLINKKWAHFFSENNFLVGISIDGPALIHDKYRVFSNNKPTFERVKRSVDILKDFNVEFNTLTVVNLYNWNKGKEVYHSLKELGSNFMQFIPIVEIEPTNNTNSKSYSPKENPTLASFSVPHFGYGQFMCDVFDEWVIHHDIGNIHVNLFDSILGNWLGYPSTTCVQSKKCGSALVIESNGDVYSCDHYVYPENKLGNLMNTNIKKIAFSRKQHNFGMLKSTKIPKQCQYCDVYKLCYGGCPKHRINTVENDKRPINYLCHSYKDIFKYTAPAMELMANSILSGRSAKDALQHITKLYML